MLTALAIQKLKPQPKEYTKTVVPGLYIRVKPNGLKIWVIKKKISGQVISKSLGQYPSITYQQATAILDQIIATNADQEKSCTFGTIFNKWISFKKDSISQQSVIKIERAFERILLPKFSLLPISMVTAPALIEAIKPYSDKTESVHKLCGWIKQMEMYAINYGLIDVSRWQGINKVFSSPKNANMASFHLKILPDFFQKFCREAVTSAFIMDAFLIAFYTLLRPGEYTKLRWDWIKDGVIHVPAEIMKMKRPHRVPISYQLQSVLERRLKISEYVLFSPRNPSKHVLPDTLEKFLRVHGFQGVLVPHGIRSIGRTWMSEHRVDFDVAELCLAHSVGSSTVKAYDRSDLLEERKKVMQQWSDFVEESIMTAQNYNQ